MRLWARGSIDDMSVDRYYSTVRGKQIRCSLDEKKSVLLPVSKLLTTNVSLRPCVWIHVCLKTAPPVCIALAVCQRFTGAIALKPQNNFMR